MHEGWRGLLDDADIRVLLFDVWGELHCFSPSEASWKWSASLLDGRPAHVQMCPPPGSLRHGPAACDGARTRACVTATGLSPLEDATSDALQSVTATTTASPTICTATTQSPSDSPSSRVSTFPQVVSPRASFPESADAATAHESLLTPKRWTCVLTSFREEAETCGGQRAASDEEDAVDEGALYRHASWHVSTPSDGAARVPLQEAIAHWNRRCPSAGRILATESQHEQFVEVDISCGRIRWDDLGDSNEEGEEEGAEAGESSRSSPSRLSSSLRSHARDVPLTLSLRIRTRSVRLSQHAARSSRSRGKASPGGHLQWQHGGVIGTGGMNGGQVAVAPSSLVLTSTSVSSISFTAASEEAAPRQESSTDGSFVLQCAREDQPAALCCFVNGHQRAVRVLPVMTKLSKAVNATVAACFVDLRRRRIWRLPLLRQRPAALEALGERATGQTSSWIPLAPLPDLGLAHIACEYRLPEACVDAVSSMEVAGRTTEMTTCTCNSSSCCADGLPADAVLDARPRHATHLVRVDAPSSSTTTASAEEEAPMKELLDRWLTGTQRHAWLASDTSGDDDDDDDGSAKEEEQHRSHNPSTSSGLSSWAAPSSVSSRGQLVAPRQRARCSEPEFGIRQTSHRESPPSPSSPAAAVSSFFDENFDPQLVLGRGATGAALLVRHRITGVFYAVKVLVARDYASEREILQEVRLHAMLDHKRLVRYIACWSELVTPRRAQQLAFIGLAKQRELMMTAATDRSHRGGSSASIPRVPADSKDRVVFSRGVMYADAQSGATMPRALSAAGWGNLKLDLADLDRRGTQALLIGEDTMTTTATSVTIHDWRDATRGTARGGVLDRVRQIHSSEDDDSVVDDDDCDDNADETTSTESDDSSAEHSSGPTFQHRPQRPHPPERPVPSIIGTRVVFLQMELCQTTLAQHLATRGCVDRIENLVIALQLLDGLHYLHKAGVLHRDIKPTNIFLDFRCQLLLDGTDVEGDEEGEEGEDAEDLMSRLDSDSSEAASDVDRAAAGVETPCSQEVHAHALPPRSRVSVVATRRDGNTGEDEGVNGAGEEKAVEADYEVIYRRHGSVTAPALDTCTALTTVPPRVSSSSSRPAQVSWDGQWRHASCYPDGLQRAHAWATSQRSGRTSLFPSPTSFTGGSNSSARGVASESFSERRQQDAGEPQTPAMARTPGQQQALALVMDPSHLSSGELIRRHLAMLAASRAGRERRRLRRKTANGTVEAATGPRATDDQSQAGHSREAVRRATDWLIEHLLQVRLGDFGLAKLVHCAPAPPQAHTDDFRSPDATDSQHERQDRRDAEDHHRRPHDNRCRPCETENSGDTQQHTTGIGSPLYASPEQYVGGARTTVASDAFSLGVVLAEMYIVPKTISERLHVLQAVRTGRFPTAEDVAAYPELAIVRQLTKGPPNRRIRLDMARAAFRRLLLDAVARQMRSDKPSG